MSRRKTTLLVFLVLCSALVITAVFVIGGRPASGQNSGDEAADSVSRINQKAALVNSGDETQIRQLADEVFKSFEIDQAPAAITESLKDRLVRAEVNYRSGRGKPVSEFGIVRMINMLADTLGAPNYAKTNVFEVRRLEMNFLPYLSQLIGKKPDGETNGPKPLGSSINPTLSPLEAVTIAGLLIQQKRFNPAYQMTQQEWVSNHGGKRGPKNFASALANRDDKRGEIERAIQQGTGALSATDLFKLPHRALDMLGVERAEGGTGQ